MKKRTSSIRHGFNIKHIYVLMDVTKPQPCIMLSYSTVHNPCMYEVIGSITTATHNTTTATMNTVVTTVEDSLSSKSDGTPGWI
jgi:hypothetical protein